MRTLTCSMCRTQEDVGVIPWENPPDVYGLVCICKGCLQKVALEEKILVVQMIDRGEYESQNPVAEQ